MEQAHAYQISSRQVVIGVGSNLGDSEKQVALAIRELIQMEWLTQARASSLYKSSPIGFLQQPDFVNAVVLGYSSASSHRILAELQAMETRAGRTEDRAKWGPRILDLDLLSVGNESVSEPGLELPHKEIVNRRFVLEPLHELDPHWKHPLTDQSIVSLIAALPTDDFVGKIEELGA